MSWLVGGKLDEGRRENGLRFFLNELLNDDDGLLYGLDLLGLVLLMYLCLLGLVLLLGFVLFRRLSEGFDRWIGDQYRRIVSVGRNIW